MTAAPPVAGARVLDGMLQAVADALGAEWLQQVAFVGEGFQESPLDNVNCRMRLRRAGQDDLIVDFMPDDAEILGFTNRWYADALQTAIDVVLHGGTVIRVVTPRRVSQRQTRRTTGVDVRNKIERIGKIGTVGAHCMRPTNDMAP